MVPRKETVWNEDIKLLPSPPLPHACHITNMPTLYKTLNELWAQWPTTFRLRQHNVYTSVLYIMSVYMCMCIYLRLMIP